MTLFKNKYRIESTRLPGWDYRCAGYYFVTICTKHNQTHLGWIRHGNVHLTRAGVIVAEEWEKTLEMRANLIADAWVVMPNHLHMIVCITHRIGTTETQKTLRPNSLSSIINQFKSACTRRIRQAGFDEFAWLPRFYESIIRDEQGLLKVRRYIEENPAKWGRDARNPASLWM